MNGPSAIAEGGPAGGPLPYTTHYCGSAIGFPFPREKRSHATIRAPRACTARGFVQKSYNPPIGSYPKIDFSHSIFYVGSLKKSFHGPRGFISKNRLFPQYFLCGIVKKSFHGPEGSLCPGAGEAFSEQSSAPRLNPPSAPKGGAALARPPAGLRHPFVVSTHPGLSIGIPGAFFPPQIES